ncbi:TRAP transporter large permease [Ruegeria pomeroyi]|nr:TRAP transporter large permease [Ruegeria pomeroyi]
MTESYIALLPISAVLFGLIAIRIPIALAMALSGFGAVIWKIGAGPAWSLIETIPIRLVTNYDLGVIPFFLIMGTVAARSDLSRELFAAAAAWMGHLRGGLSVATLTACAGFSAICGSSVATAASMSKIAVPEMRRFGYSPRASIGAVAAGGTLGILIPPSVALAVYAILTQQDIGALLIAGILPGLLALTLYIVAAVLWARLDPAGLPRGERTGYGDRLCALRKVWAILAIFAAIVGGIYAGVFTPTEAASVGAVATIVLGFVRRRLDWWGLIQALSEAVRGAADIYLILIGAFILNIALTLYQIPQSLVAQIATSGLSPGASLALIIAFYLILGCVLDAMAMVTLTIPIVYPIVTAIGVDPIWFGILIVCVVELALITPPIGMNLFVIKTAFPEYPLVDAYAGVIPFILADIARLGLILVVPAIATVLPEAMN